MQFILVTLVIYGKVIYLPWLAHTLIFQSMVIYVTKGMINNYCGVGWKYFKQNTLVHPPIKVKTFCALHPLKVKLFSRPAYTLTFSTPISSLPIDNYLPLLNVLIYPSLSNLVIYVLPCLANFRVIYNVYNLPNWSSLVIIWHNPFLFIHSPFLFVIYVGQHLLFYWSYIL